MLGKCSPDFFSLTKIPSELSAPTFLLCIWDDSHLTSTVWGQGPRQAALGPRGLSLCYSLHGCYPQSPGTPNTQQLVLGAATCSAPLLLRLKAANESSLQTFEAMEKRWEMFKKSQHRTFLCNNSLCAIKV